MSKELQFSILFRELVEIEIVLIHQTLKSDNSVIALKLTSLELDIEEKFLICMN